MLWTISVNLRTESCMLLSAAFLGLFLVWISSSGLTLFHLLDSINRLTGSCSSSPLAMRFSPCFRLAPLRKYTLP